MAKFEDNVQALMKSVEDHISTKTIVGEPIRYDNMTVFPMIEVSMGLAAGAFSQEKKDNGLGGVGVKMTPSAVLVIQDGVSKIINIKDKNSMNKIIEMVPDILNKITETWGPNSHVETARSENVPDEAQQ